MSLLDEPRRVRPGQELDAGRLSDYLEAELGWRGPLEIEQFPSGYSNLTYLVRAGDRELVLRRPPPGTKAATAHDMGREYRVLTALRPHLEVCPEPLFFCQDEDVLGAPFYGMQRLRGVILRRDLPPELALGPAQVRRLCENLADVHAGLHALDPEELGLGEAGRAEGYVTRQVEGWSRRYRKARTEDAPDFEEVMAWLPEHLPSSASRPVLVHGDYKLDNVVLDPEDPTRIIGVLDWEMCTVGDPWMDLGASLAYWVQSDDPDFCQAFRTMPTDAPGALTRDALVTRYAASSGLEPSDFTPYRVFGLFRLAGIAQQIYHRFVHGQTRDPRFGQMIHAVKALERAALGELRARGD